MTVRLRFAPSPTGYLHVGNIRIALLNVLYCRQHQGHLILRIDDTDRERSSDAYTEAIRFDLQWLGLDWDDSFMQSERLDRYQAQAEHLRDRLYACYETVEELEVSRKLALRRGQPPVYNRAALTLTDQQRQTYEAQGRRPYWRFKLDTTAINWQDMAAGEVQFAAGHLSDPVLIRADGRPLYTLTSVVDDMNSNITHVMRGADHISNTAVQVQLFQALGHPPPAFGHFPLIADHQGRSLSKRDDSLSVRHLRDQGMEPETLTGYLARLGTAYSAAGYLGLAELAAEFDPQNFGRASPRFDVQELWNLNKTVISEKPIDRERLAQTDISEDLWAVCHHNLERFSDIVAWREIVNANWLPQPLPDQASRDVLAVALQQLPPTPWDSTTFASWIMAIKKQCHCRGRALFLPLRLALTGRPDGPELGKFLLLLDPQRVTQRLQAATA